MLQYIYIASFDCLIVTKGLRKLGTVIYIFFKFNSVSDGLSILRQITLAQVLLLDLTLFCLGTVYIFQVILMQFNSYIKSICLPLLWPNDLGHVQCISTHLCAICVHLFVVYNNVRNSDLFAVYYYISSLSFITLSVFS